MRQPGRGRAPIPTLILVGAKDEVTPARDCAELAKRQQPGMVRFVVYPGLPTPSTCPSSAEADGSWACRSPTTATPLSDRGTELRSFLAARLKR